MACVCCKAKAHPELAATNEIVFTYITNRRGAMANVYEQGELETYVPRFVRLVYKLDSWQLVNGTAHRDL